MHGLTKQLARCLTAGAPAIGLLLACGAAASAGTAATHHSHVRYSAQVLSSARSELRKLLTDEHDAVQWYDDRGPSAASKNSSGVSQDQSTNWAGYADTGSGFTRVSASWVEPTATCGAQASVAAFWVGIDGFASTSVEQDGTLIECQNGQPFYFTWWEMFPSNAVQIVGQTVNPGDTIDASVTRTALFFYKLAVTDVTTPADSFSTTQLCFDCADASAEWIAEAPTGQGGVSPLAQFGVWRTSNDKVSAGSRAGAITSFPDNEITLVDSRGAVEAQPGNLNPAGNFFRVTWESST